ncbi:hypothetical protein F7725_027215 [Dissostichus mawsoni]|uniref:Uncharacterized protein n=1 Tax=Dissostichus mawsoni TaxID=36200 RepID=A0A7J5XDJ3_DISMA|nr:hypothetical protein F7725_027215 [Dissostichus mawsoni]
MLIIITNRSGSSPALPRKQLSRDKSPAGLLDDAQDLGTFTRDRKTGFFSSFIKKKSSSSSSSSSQNLPTPPKRSSSFREMETQPHKKYEPTADFSAPPPLPQSDSSIVGGFSASPSHSHSHSDPPSPSLAAVVLLLDKNPHQGGV